MTRGAGGGDRTMQAAPSAGWIPVRPPFCGAEDIPGDTSVTHSSPQQIEAATGKQGPMLFYRFYSVGRDGHTTGLPATMTCLDDKDAIKKAQVLRRMSGHSIEVWNRARRVALIERD